MSTYCRRCGRRKRAGFDGEFVHVHCPHCSGIDGFLRRLLFGVDRVSPLPDNWRVCSATHAYLDGEIDEAELEQRIEDAL